LEYDGTDYHGWQVQPGVATVQGVLQDAMARVVQASVHIVGAGRTDAGAHALGQVASVRAEFRHPPDILRRALSSLLPPDIVVTRVEETASDFDAQRSARWKHYRYTLLTRPFPSALEHRYTLFVPRPLKVAAMAEAARMLIGEHDFSSFQAAGSSAHSPIRQVFEATIREQDDHLWLDIVASGFLRHMVRIVMGTLLDVGHGRYSSGDVKAILEARDRRFASKTLPAHALCLIAVGYQPYTGLAARASPSGTACREAGPPGPEATG